MTTTAQTTHTPGPWGCTETEGSWTISADADPVYIATVAMPGRMSKVDQAEANARLIAAAPELLEACQLALDSLNSLVATNTLSKQLLRAAIARATGK